METDAIRRIKTHLNARYDLADLGTYSCRKARSNSGESLGYWSEHAWGNAWDFQADVGDAEAIAIDLDQMDDVHWWKHYGGGQFHITAEPPANPNRDATPPCIDDDATTEELDVLQRGDRGNNVLWVQRKINEYRELARPPGLGVLAEDGIYGDKTAQAVEALEDHFAYPPTGVWSFTGVGGRLLYQLARHQP